MTNQRQLQNEIARAIRLFWQTRDGQSTKQQAAGRSDQGARGAVTGGKQMDGFVQLVRHLTVAQGMPESSIHTETSLELPGYYRPEKKWDVVIVDDHILVAAIETKSQIGPSFGNNFNNRTEEAIGTAQDIWTAYREGAFSTTARPWLGYIMLLEDCERSKAPVKVKQPHFSVFPEFVNASYAERYQLFLTKLVRERLYDSACFLLSSHEDGLKGKSTEPNSELSFTQFIASLTGRIATHMVAKKQPPKRRKS